MKTNKGLVEYCKAQIGRPYWFGTFGQIASERLLASKCSQYPKQFSSKRVKKAEDHFGQKVHDCYGLYKGYLMSKDPNSEAVYDKKYDISADAAFKKASETGTIDTLPEIEGIGLYKKGHFGVYIGNGKEIEARGFDYGVIEAEVKDTKFTHWFKLPEIEYVDNAPSEAQNASVTPSEDENEKVYVVKKNDTLSKIAARYGVSVDDLCNWNSIENPDVILIGQKIKVTSPVKEAVNKNEYKKAMVITKELPLNIRSGSSRDSMVIGRCEKGSIIKIAYETAGWAKLYGQQGFVKVDFIKYL